MDNPELKFSPSPWYMLSSDGYIYSEGQSSAKGGDGGDVVARSPSSINHAKSFAHWPHNAKLICAAPEMVATMIMAVSLLETDKNNIGHVMALLRQSIEKAL